MTRKTPWRALALVAAAGALPALASACSSGSNGSGPATVIGRVENESGAGIGGALVALEGDSVTSAGDGTFRLRSDPGTRTLDVSADGYRAVRVDLRLARGENTVEITLVVCTPGIDAGCDSPTPTPTASPTPNVAAVFDGTNPDFDVGQIFQWTGQADLAGPTSALSLGEDDDAIPTGSDLAFGECWDDAAETDSHDGVGTPDHCVFWWDGENEALDGTDAVFYVRIPGVAYQSGNVLTFQDGMTAGYYQGDLSNGSVRILDYTLVHPAVSGTLEIGDAGTTGGQAVSITGTATFYIPTLP